MPFDPRGFSNGNRLPHCVSTSMLSERRLRPAVPRPPAACVRWPPVTVEKSRQSAESDHSKSPRMTPKMIDLRNTDFGVTPGMRWSRT